MALTILHNVSIKKCRSLYLVYFIEKWLDISSDHDSGKNRGKPAKSVVKDLEKVTGKYLFAGLKPAFLSKKDSSDTGVFL